MAGNAIQAWLALGNIIRGHTPLEHRTRPAPVQRSQQHYSMEKSAFHRICYLFQVTDIQTRGKRAFHGRLGVGSNSGMRQVPKMEARVILVSVPNCCERVPPARSYGWLPDGGGSFRRRCCPMALQARPQKRTVP